MLARKVLDLAEKQGLLDGKAIAELRRAVAESKFIVTPEAVAKVLVDHGHLTPFQARKVVNEALGPDPEPAPPPPRPRMPEVELTLAEDEETKSSAPAEEEIVELEAVEPTPRPKPAPSPKKAPVAKPKAPAVGAKPAFKGADDDLVPLEPVPRPSAPIRSPLKPLPPQSHAPDLQPIPTLTPLPDLFAVDPLAPTAPAGPLGNPLSPQPALPRRVAKNVWDSPFLLIGGGALGVILVVFGVLFYALTSGSAAELFNKAEEEYRNGAYASAIAGYDSFLDRYASDANASLARVRRAMAQLRQVSDDGKNPRQALQTAQQLMPQIETEPQFQEARSELATLLPDIADGLATLAGSAQEMAKKEELVKLAGAAMELVNNPLYLPASLRKDREERIATVLDKLKVAERSIQQDKKLATAIEEIKKAVADGNAAEAYRIRTELLRTYPSAESSKELQTVTLLAGEKERQLVQVTEPGTAAPTDDPAAEKSAVVIAAREGPAPAGEPKPVFVLVEGAIYALDLGSGHVLWRRYVGFETTAQPLTLVDKSGNDAVVLDGRSNELSRLKGATGQLVWRQPLGDAAAGPVQMGDHLVVTTRKGRVVQIEASSGKIVRAAQLPQGAQVAAAVDARDGRQPRLLQLGEHSTLFVLAGDTLACTDTYYLGHKAGAIFVPPVAVLDQVLVGECPADDYTLIHVLSPDAKTRRLTEQTHFRLKGRIVTPLATSRNRAAAVTDLGQIAVYEIDPSNAKEPVRLIVGAEGGEPAPLAPYYALDGNRLWLANKWRKLLELQPAVQQLTHKWTEDRGDSFITPLQVKGDVLIHVRRRPGGAAVLVEASNAVSGKTIWTTHLAAPVAAISASPARPGIDLLTAEGRLFSLSPEQLRGGVVDQPAFTRQDASGSAILPEVARSADGHTLLWTDAAAGGRIYSYQTSSGRPPTATSLPEASAEAAASAQLLAEKLLVPLTSGSILLLESGTGKQAAQAFVPALMPGTSPRWTRPVAQADGAGFLISDGLGLLYCVALKAEPQPRLVSVNETKTDAPVVALVGSAGGTVFGVMRGQTSDSIAGFDSRGATTFAPVPLSGRVQKGPFTVGGLLLVASEPGGLACIEASGKQRWQVPLERGPLAGPPLACEGSDLLVIHQAGIVRRLDSAKGTELAAANVGEPLGGAAHIMGTDVFLGGSDGVLHRLALPPRS